MSNKTAIKYISVILLLCFNGFILRTIPGLSQKMASRAPYIALYSDLAISEMRRSGIPASITMAQAILESQVGQSDLATQARNHFGIKCHLEWEGERFYYDDDEEDECFRVYDNPEESFRDHSIFLLTRDRYKGLFDLDPMDYKGWAKGLKSAGYATNPKYAELLIKIIEDEQLYQLDNSVLPVVSKNSTEEDVPAYDRNFDNLPSSHTQIPHFNKNRIDLVVARKGETVESLTEKLNLLRWEIRKYNELDRDEQIEEGQVVYLQPKRKRAAKGYSFHIVEKGETIYSISQQYGIKTKWILKRNNLSENVILRAGEKIWLRRDRPEDKFSRK